MQKQTRATAKGKWLSAQRSALLALLLGITASCFAPALVEAGGTASFVRGDANADGAINIVDPIFVLAYLVGDQDAICLDSADVNDDGSVNVVDAVYHFHFLFEPGFAPPTTPFPACGTDPTPDALDCADFPVCP